MRVYEFAKELNKDAGDFVHELRSKFGLEIKSHLSAISEEQMEQIRTTYNQNLLSSLTDLKDELEKQVDDSHKQDLKETFNDTIDLKEPDDLKEPEFISYDLVKNDEESKRTKDEWALGSGDDIVPPENKLDEKGIKKLKEKNEKAVQSSMKSAKESREKYATTVTNVVENPDSWHVGGDTPKIVVKQQEVILEKPSWLSRMLAWWIGS